jgi:hypothetical protein
MPVGVTLPVCWICFEFDSSSPPVFQADVMRCAQLYLARQPEDDDDEEFEDEDDDDEQDQEEEQDDE